MGIKTSMELSYLTSSIANLSCLPFSLTSKNIIHNITNNHHERQIIWNHAWIDSHPVQVRVQTRRFVPSFFTLFCELKSLVPRFVCMKLRLINVANLSCSTLPFTIIPHHNSIWISSFLLTCAYRSPWLDTVILPEIPNWCGRTLQSIKRCARATVRCWGASTEERCELKITFY